MAGAIEEAGKVAGGFVERDWRASRWRYRCR